MSDDVKEQARRRLCDIVPHLQIAASMAKLQEPEGKVGLAVISKKADGSGRVTATFECEQFFEDLGVILDFKLDEESDEEVLPPEE